MNRRLALCVLALGLAGNSTRLFAQRAADSVTVPLMVDANRPFVTLTFHRRDGSTRSARFLLDTGGGGFLITEPLARDLGLEWGATSREEGQEFGVVTNTPTVSLGDFPLQLTPSRVLVLVGSQNVLPNAAAGHAEGMLPAHVLSLYHVVLDYPKGTLTIARAGVLSPKGTASPMPVGRTGFPRTEIVVGGATYGMLLDAGASFTMVSEVLLKKWGSEHPDWQRHAGAFGEAATLGGQTLETMFVPSGTWQGHDLGEFGVTSQREGTFERYMSGMMTSPIVGSLAGNVLEHFRVELDYPNQKLYLSTP